MMKVEQLRQEDTSSGYGSRESLAERLLLPNKQNDVAVQQQQPNNYCKRSGYNRKSSLSKGTFSPHCAATMTTSDNENSIKKSQRHSHISLVPSSIENKPDNSVKRSHRHSHSSLASPLDNEMVSYVKKSHRHSHSSLAPTLDDEIETCVKNTHRNSHSSLTPSLNNEVKNSIQKSHKHSHSSLAPVLNNETLLTHPVHNNVNEDLVLKNKELMEENCRLMEELQLLRRFFHGTLNDLNIQLSAGESKIMLLQETICTYKEALTESNVNIPKIIHDDEELLTNVPLKELTSTECHIQEEKNSEKCLNEHTKVASVRKCRKRSDSAEPRKRSLKSLSSSTTASITSESSVKSRTSLLQGRNFTKMKEKLVERNQSLKTDIAALLKVQVKVSDMVSNVVPLQTEEIKPSSTSDDMTECKENVPLKKNKLLTSEVSGKRCHKDRNRSEKRLLNNKSEKNKVGVEKREMSENIFITQLQREGTLTLEEHKEKLTQEYKTKEEVERTQNSSMMKDDIQVSASFKLL